LHFFMGLLNLAAFRRKLALGDRLSFEHQTREVN
jgi:hypothetical protein